MPFSEMKFLQNVISLCVSKRVDPLKSALQDSTTLFILCHLHFTEKGNGGDGMWYGRRHMRSQELGQSTGAMRQKSISAPLLIPFLPIVTGNSKKILADSCIR